MNDHCNIDTESGQADDGGKQHVSLEIPGWQVLAGNEELKNIAEGNTELVDWQEIQKEPTEGKFYDDFRESVREIKLHKEGELKLKDASQFLNEL